MAGLVEGFMAEGAQEYRKHNEVRILRRLNPLFGPRIRIVESIPKGKLRLWERLEEDIDDSAFALATRIYDGSGKVAVEIRVKKHRTIKGMPVMEEMETIADTPMGRMVTVTRCSDMEVEQ